MATIQLAALLPVPVTPLAPSVQHGPAALPVLPAAVPLVAAADAAPAAGQPLALPANPGAAMAEAASMRPDQLFMARQMAWPALDGATLAHAWRGMAATYGLQLAAQQQQANGQHLPGNLLMAGQFPPAQPGQPPALQWHPDAWRFVTPGPARPMTLRVLDGGTDQPPGRRRRGKAALRVELTLPDGMRASVQLEALPDGVMMELAAPYTSSLELLRAALPALREAIARAGLTLVRTTLRHALAPARPLQDARMAAALPDPLFRAMADVALLLAMPAAPEAP
ncbi:hypothetical protein ACFSQU_03355 [Massilia sp. GCM10020059]|uniref:Flagellar hook-length control protein FliK n=1 Tax=Massilia agrisoli TaxID=2892444 RepID=A0ABS8IPX5_9BURK|nr:hypothetical protein [Massilia agrisoli]MCC6069956.1 hypothetical protein [Massilia agrisoli]